MQGSLAVTDCQAVGCRPFLARNATEVRTMAEYTEDQWMSKVGFVAEKIIMDYFADVEAKDNDPNRTGSETASGGPPAMTDL